MTLGINSSSHSFRTSVIAFPAVLGNKILLLSNVKGCRYYIYNFQNLQKRSETEKVK